MRYMPHCYALLLLAAATSAAVIHTDNTYIAYNVSLILLF